MLAANDVIDLVRKASIVFMDLTILASSMGSFYSENARRLVHIMSH